MEAEATFTTEAQAETYIKYLLGVSAALGTLTVQSAAGSSSGETTITVNPARIRREHVCIPDWIYRNPADIRSDDERWSTWDGSSDIAATTGNEIGIVEVNASNQAVAAGKTTVTANAG